MNIKLKIIFGFIFFIGIAMPGKSINVKRIEPSSWWTGMKNPKLMLMVYGDSISSAESKINIPGVSVDEIKKVENKNYLFIYLTISEKALPGKYQIVFNKNEKDVASYPFQLFQRQ